MNFYRLLIWSIGAVLAAFVAYASYVIVHQVRAPSLQAAPYLWHTATSETNFAYAAFASRKSKQADVRVQPQELRVAKHAYRVEPLSSAALALMIAAMDGEKTPDVRGKLIELAGQLNRRSAIITAYSMEEAARAHDQKDFFTWMSRAILTDSKLRTRYIGAMATATATNGAVEALLPVLGANPSWAKFYWAAVTSRPASLANATTLRIAVGEAPWRQAELGDTDYLLARRLADAGQFDNVRRLARAFEKTVPGQSSANELLTNGNFAREPLLPPIDWSLTASGHLGAAVEAPNRRLAISAIAGAFGLVARQLVELTQGEYRVAWTLDVEKGIGDRALSVNLICAEKDAQATQIQPVALAAGTHVQYLAVPSETCRWYWFSINAQVPDNAAGVDAFLSQMSLTRAR